MSDTIYRTVMERSEDTLVPARPARAFAEAPPREEDVAELRQALLEKLTLAIGKDPAEATTHDWFRATALAVRDRVVRRGFAAERAAAGIKQVAYFSLEFLIGRLLTDTLSNLGLTETVRTALAGLGVDFARVRDVEPDAALGNGGLGRLAACFMESMASLGIPACGYGIRYDHGLFRQVVKQGWQQEFPEDWLSFGNPWEFPRPEVVYDVNFGGTVETVAGPDGRTRFVWHPAETIEAVAYDVPIVGWRGRRVNPLRLWSARAADPLRLDVFNQGDHVGAQAEQARAEAISKFLYPSDESPAGQELRLRQEYFFVSASLQDLVRRHLRAHGDIRSLPRHAAIQLNDTHPAVAVAELMRLLVDEHGLAWDEAWTLTRATLSYTNHTLLPEALESWPVGLFERLLPRHLEIVYLVNALHLEAAERGGTLAPGDLAAISLIEEGHGRRVRMGHLAFVGAHRVNGVSALHTNLLRETVFGPLDRVYPGRIVNETNGITFRRWLHQANPGLTRLLRAACGEEVLDDPAVLGRLAMLADDPAVRDEAWGVKRLNKAVLASLIRERLDLAVDPNALFDVHIKRIHEYKRQLLNLIETVALYQAIRDDPGGEWVPRVKVFAGKAAASYARAKLIIKLAGDVAAVVNNDPAMRGLLKVAFLPNYNVSLAETIIPAADLSEQISTAGMEASGTGNMKLALNGALTIGTLDGANIEIRDRVGEDNIFIFGLTAEEVAARAAAGLDASATIAAEPMLARALEAVAGGAFSPDDPHRFSALIDGLRRADRYMVAADFAAYWAMQRRLDRLWRDPRAWTRTALANIAGMGWFSADRAIRGYAADVWNVPAEGGGAGA